MRGNFLQSFWNTFASMLGLDEPVGVKPERYPTPSKKVETPVGPVRKPVQPENPEATSTELPPVIYLGTAAEPEPTKTKVAITPQPVKAEAAQETTDTQREVPETVEAEVVTEVVDTPKEQPEISVNVNVQVPADTKVNVTVNVCATQTEEPFEFKEPPYRQGYDYAGVKLTPTTKHHAVNLTRRLILDRAEYESPKDVLWDDPETRLYELMSESDDLVSDGFAPTAKQIQVYYSLREFCETLGILQNHRDIPMCAQEYTIAIKNLRRALSVAKEKYERAMQDDLNFEPTLVVYPRTPHLLNSLHV